MLVQKATKKSYFNSHLPFTHYRLLKIEAVKLNITIKQHISNVLKDYIEKNLQKKV